MTIDVALNVNGATRHMSVALDETLLTSLRDRLGLTAAKRGCNQGVCGACTIEIDGVPMRACLSLAVNCDGLAVQTIEGASADSIMQALQDAFVVHAGLQCGFCTPGMLVAARALLRTQSRPSVADVQTALSGNLCRCTGYRKIIDAVQAAAQTLHSA